MRLKYASSVAIVAIVSAVAMAVPASAQTARHAPASSHASSSSHSASPSASQSDSTTTCSTNDNDVTTCITQGTISIAFGADQESSSAHAVSTGSAGVKQLFFENPNATAPTGPAAKVCQWVTGGTNTYYDIHHHLVPIDWSGKKAFICPSKSSPSGWRKYGPGHPCGNVFYPPHMKHPPVFRGKFQVHRWMTFLANALARSSSTGTVSVSADANQPSTGCHAHADSTAHGKAVASAKASARAHSAGSAKAKAEAKAKLIARDRVSGRATANTKTSVRLWAEALAFCSGSPLPPSQSIKITSMTTLNKIDAGKSSGDFNVTVNASDAGGELAVDPGIGSVSDCSGGAMQGSMTFSSLAAGDSTLCMQFWAPNDADQPPTMTVKFTATLGSANDVESETFDIGYPTRP